MKNLVFPILTTLLALAALAAQSATTVTVGTTSDGTGTSPLTLRAAVNNANNASGGSLPYTILVPPGTYKLTSGELDLGTVAAKGDNVSILGTGTSASTVILQSDGVNRVFNLDPNSVGGATFALANVTISGGHDSADGDGGGGILTGNGGSGAQDFLFMTNCVISNNVATGVGGGVGSDGGSATLVGCTFVKNTETGAAGSNMRGAGFEFSPENTGDTLTALNCQFLQNAITATGSGQYAGGAGLSLDEANSHSTLGRITNCVFAGNVASMANYTSAGLEDYGGGGVYIATASTVSIIGCTFSNNVAKGSVGGVNSTGGNGGAILVAESQTSTIIEYCRFIGNVAAAGGGSNIWGSTYGTSAITANDDWWGSDAGPANGVNANITTLANWLFLTNTTSAASVPVGGTATLTASFLKDSAGNSISTANLMALTNVPVSFGAVDGSISSAQSVIQSSGTATATFTGTTSGGGSGSATVDGATSTTSITVQAPLTVVSTVSSSPANHYYKAGQTVPVTVTFSAAVTVTGTPKLALSDGGSAPYSSGSGTTTLTFNYVVASGDTSSHLDYASTTALTLNGGTINSSGGAATLTLPAPGAAGSLGADTTIVIDTTMPSVTISPASVTSTNSGSVNYNVNFTDANFAGASLTALNLVTNKAGSATLTNITVTSGTGTTTSTNYTVILAGVAGNGTLGFTVPASAASDLAGNQSAAAESGTFTVFVATPPVLTGVRTTGKGIVQFDFTNNPNASFTVLSSTNLLLALTNWTAVGTATNNPPGVFQYTSPPTTNDSQRFYIIRSP